MTAIVSNNKEIQLLDYNVEAFERKTNKGKADKFSRFLLSVQEKGNHLVFKTASLYPRLLRLLPKTNLSNKQQASILQFFREKNGLPEEGADNDTLLELLKFADKVGDEPLKKHCIAHISKRIEDANDGALLRSLIEHTRHFSNKSFLKPHRDKLFATLLEGDCKTDFDAQLVSNLEQRPHEFARLYLKSKQIPFKERSDKQLAVSLSDFITLFNDKKEIEILKFMAEAIDALSLEDNTFAYLYLIPQQYRNAIQMLSIEPPLKSVTPAEAEELQQLFINVKCVDLLTNRKAIEKAIQTNPDNAFFRIALGVSWAKQKKCNMRDKSYEKALELTKQGSESAFVSCALAANYINLNRLFEAEEHAREAVRLHPKFAAAYALLGLTLKRQAYYGEARAMLQKAFELNPKFASASQELANLLEENKDVFEKAASRAALFAQDKKLLESDKKQTLTELGKSLLNGPVKFSRRLGGRGLTHSYIVTPEGEIFQQLHKNQGVLPHHVKDDLQVVIGQGGNKIANLMANASGHLSIVRAVGFREEFSLHGSVAASRNEKFKNCKNLLVGSYVSYQSAKTGKYKYIILLPYVPGGDLSGKTFRIDEARRIILGVALGLQVVHNDGWAHLDIKPSNILGDKLFDFDLGGDFKTGGNSIKILHGSPGYESPEQLRGECYGKEAAQRCDMFSLGVTMLAICGFSIKECVIAKKKQKIKTKEALRNAMKQLDFVWLSKEFTKFKKNLSYSLTDKDTKYLNLAWNLVSEPPQARHTIEETVELLKMIA